MSLQAILRKAASGDFEFDTIVVPDDKTELNLFDATWGEKVAGFTKHASDRMYEVKCADFSTFISVPGYVFMHRSADAPTAEIDLYLADAHGAPRGWGPRITIPRKPITGEDLIQLIYDAVTKYGVMDCETDECRGMAWETFPHTHTTPDGCGFRNGYRPICETCRQKMITDHYAVVAAKQAARDAIRYNKAKAEGFTHVTIAWVHPNRGDDYSLEILSKGEMPIKQIQDTLRRRRSSVLTDFKQRPL